MSNAQIVALPAHHIWHAANILQVADGCTLSTYGNQNPSNANLLEVSLRSATLMGFEFWSTQSRGSCLTIKTCMQAMMWGHFSQPDRKAATKTDRAQVPAQHRAAVPMQQPTPMPTQPPDWRTTALSTAQYDSLAYAIDPLVLPFIAFLWTNHDHLVGPQISGIASDCADIEWASKAQP